MRRECRAEGCRAYVSTEPVIRAAGLCFKHYSASRGRTVRRPWVRAVEVKVVEGEDVGSLPRGRDPEPPAEGETGIRCSGCGMTWSLASFAPSVQARGAGYCRRCSRERAATHRLGLARPTIQ